MATKPEPLDPERCKIQGFRAGAKKHSGKMKKIL